MARPPDPAAQPGTPDETSAIITVKCLLHAILAKLCAALRARRLAAVARAIRKGLASMD